MSTHCPEPRRYPATVPRADQVSLRPNSVKQIDTDLRHFAVPSSPRHHPDVNGVADMTRTHIEEYKPRLTTNPGTAGKQPAKTTTGKRLGHLRGFFDRIIEWDYPDPPPRNLVFAGDMPIRDRPLPRFLDDAALTKLTAARAMPDLFDRVAVEVLARTGLRKGEFLGLTRDAVVRSVAPVGCALRSANCTPTATSHYIRASKTYSTQWICAHPPTTRATAP